MIRVLLVISSAVAVSGVARAQTPQPRRLVDELRVPVRYATVFGQRLAYYEAGPPRAPTLVLIPSLGWDARSEEHNLPALAGKYHVIAVDPLGLGRSDKPLIDYTMEHRRTQSLN